ncbi:MAG: Glycosyl hydrolase family 57 [Bacteroidetes bacterium ADurb.Bin217]|nr:MAG: Glycosyl hydrolase family 57 [Bacteroidetes bacterium ADurb.Bin217]
MKNICLLFQVNHPFQLRSYRFFDIGHDHYYYDDFSNKSNMLKIAKRCYLPMNEILLSLLKTYKGKFKVNFSISGSAIDHFEMYAPEVIESFKLLAKTGHVEFTAETYAHSLVSVKSPEEFAVQVQKHAEKIKDLFGKKPKVFSNAELIYSDYIGEQVYNMGFEGIIAEGAKQVLGWKSPNFVYCNANNPRLKVLLRNYKLSDDISLRFSNQSWSEWPLTASKFRTWIESIPANEEVLNLVMDYKTFGEYHKIHTGIFDFFKAFVGEILSQTTMEFATPSEIVAQYQPVSVLSVPNNTSWSDEERDLSSWLGNNLQREAFENVYSLLDEVRLCTDESILKDWYKLQSSNNFQYMSTKYFATANTIGHNNPYPTPYEAFINYMNVIADFAERVKKCPKSNDLQTMSTEQIDEEIEKASLMLKQLMDLKSKQKKSKKISK